MNLIPYTCTIQEIKNFLKRRNYKEKDSYEVKFSDIYKRALEKGELALSIIAQITMTIFCHMFRKNKANVISMNEWVNLLIPYKPQDKKEKLCENLLEYCEKGGDFISYLN